MARTNVGFGLTLERVEERKGSPDNLYLLRKGEQIVGYLSKWRNSRVTQNPWKAFRGIGFDARYLGSFYEEGKGAWPVPTGADGGGKAAAIRAVAAAL